MSVLEEDAVCGNGLFTVSSRSDTQRETSCNFFWHVSLNSGV